MQDEEREGATSGGEAETPVEESGGKAKAKRGGDKTRRSPAERAMSNIRSAKKGQREVSDPVERARFLLAEANVLALLELADAIGGGTERGAGQPPAEPEASE